MSLLDKNIRWQYPPAFLPRLVPAFLETMAERGYETFYQASMINGTHEVSLSKGGFFASVLGLKTAINLTFSCKNGGILLQTEIGLFKQQLVPTAVNLLLFWPVIATQIAGLVIQSKLDQEIIEVLDSLLARMASQEKIVEIDCQPAP